MCLNMRDTLFVKFLLADLDSRPFGAGIINGFRTNFISSSVAQPKAAPVSSSREEMSKEMGKGAVRREEDGGLGMAVSVGSVGWNVLGLDDPIVGVSDSDKEKK